ncbi:MAG: hypothetical protein KGO49_02770 [Gammaproteobacteria bacterium]|nr:hypothetical protein [Gammaproteobacteria bacterium]
MVNFIPALFSLFGAILGVVLSHYYSNKRKRKDELIEFRLKAYSDFINATSRLTIARRNGQASDEVSELAILNDAKLRICICASAFVTKALIDFWDKGGTLEKESEILAFTRFCLCIRKDLGNTEKLHFDISQTLFKLQPSTYSYKNEQL